MNQSDIPLILASQSPRRKMLLEQSGFQFTIHAPEDSVEKQAKAKTPEQFVVEAATLKAYAVAQEITTLDRAILVAADTVAECEGQILGKPEDRDDAERMLKFVSGKVHRVLTGVCLKLHPNGPHLAKLEATLLRMDPLSKSMLDKILKSNLWVGKAGAFGYQDGLDWVHIESGLASNVVGLPVERMVGWIDELSALTHEQKLD